MPEIKELLRQGRQEDAWQMCCGFIDLSLEQFMAIQKRLLLEQLKLLKSCELGRKVMHGALPETVEEFRAQVPLTTYADYCPELLERREDVLPARPVRWVRTSGKTGEYPAKWAPMTEDFCRELEKVCGSTILFSMRNEHDDLPQFNNHLKGLFALGPVDYGSGVLGYYTQQAIGFEFLPSHMTDEMAFDEIIKAGFEEALSRGMDGFGGLSSVLVAVGDQFNQRLGKMDIRFLLSHPRALLRLAKGLIKSKLAHRPLLPKDLWSVKAIVGGGTDSAIFRKKVGELWGKYPLEIYAGTEGGFYATQTSDYEGMTFVPTLNFFEFIPEREHIKWQLDHAYQPRTILLDEVKAGEVYEIVITNFHGGIMTRYRPGDMVRITSLHNDRLNINLPQMIFERRADDLIDITGFGKLTEKIIWQAIENTGIPYADWAACKETVDNRPMLHIYLELKDNHITYTGDVATAVYEQLIKLDEEYHYNIYRPYGDPETVLGVKPVVVTLLPQGAFASYIARRQAEGAPLGHLKPQHINPPDKVLALLGAKKEAVPEEKIAVNA